MEKKEKVLLAAHWARELDADGLARVVEAMVFRSYPKGTIVIELGEMFDPWVGVVDGLLKMRTLSVDGKEVSFAGLHAGAWFGEGSVLKQEARQYEIVALRDSELALLNRDTFMWLLDHSAEFSRFLVYQFNERLGQFIAQVQYDRLHGPTARVARTLSLLLNPVLYPNVEDQLKISQEEIGLFAGVTRSVANQALKELEGKGIVQLEYGGIRILDADALRTVED